MRPTHLCPTCGDSIGSYGRKSHEAKHRRDALAAMNLSDGQAVVFTNSIGREFLASVLGFTSDGEYVKIQREGYDKPFQVEASELRPR